MQARRTDSDEDTSEAVANLARLKAANPKTPASCKLAVPFASGGSQETDTVAAHTDEVDPATTGGIRAVVQDLQINLLHYPAGQEAAKRLTACCQEIASVSQWQIPPECAIKLKKLLG